MSWPKAYGKKLLERMVNRNRFNDSYFYHLYLNIRFPSHARRKRAECRFYQEALKPVGAKLVFDIGANSGSKTAVFSSFAERVVTVEPDPTAVRSLQERFLYNPKVAVVAKGVGAAVGSLRFYMFAESDCYNTFSPKWAETLAVATADRPVKTAKTTVDIPVTTLDRLIAEYGVPSYVKIDVEGFELEVIKGLGSRVPLLSLECNLPEFAKETVECLAALAKLSPAAEFNFCVTEPPERFASEHWLTHQQISSIVASGKYGFMEIYCRSL